MSSPTDMSTEPAQRILREPECRNVTGLSRAQRWRLEKAERFPSRIQLSERAFGWLETEVRAWLADRIRERDRLRRPSIVA
jgi:prophage regulatory protein